jgi:hypothetical protein
MSERSPSRVLHGTAGTFNQASFVSVKGDRLAILGRFCSTMKQVEWPEAGHDRIEETSRRFVWPTCIAIQTSQITHACRSAQPP